MLSRSASSVAGVGVAGDRRAAARALQAQPHAVAASPQWSATPTRWSLAVVGLALLVSGGCGRTDLTGFADTEGGTGIVMTDSATDGPTTTSTTTTTTMTSGWTMTGTTTTEPGLCGDGVIDPWEECDSWNVPADCGGFGDPFGYVSCTADCKLDFSTCGGNGGVCGDGVVAGNESCDLWVPWPYDSCSYWYGPGWDGYIGCTSTCGYDFSSCFPVNPGVCGDGVLDFGSESCDSADLGGQTCATLGLGSGVLACTSLCTFDTLGCSGTAGVCGDGVVNQLGEVCDGGDLAGQTCGSLGLGSGVLKCAPGCAFDTAGCSSTMPVCGDGTINQPGEMCDGLDFGGTDCKAFGYTGGALACDPMCGIDLGGCYNEMPVCGDGLVQGGEQCDGDLLGYDCTSFGFAGGTLGCVGCQFDLSQCNPIPPGMVCGNGVVEGTEQCDGGNGGKDCTSFGFDSGVLKCTGCKFNTTQCLSNMPVCGDGVVEGKEQCDGGNGGLDCTSFGFDAGVLKCQGCKFNTSSCTFNSVCGNGLVESGEACDSDNLNGITCGSLGFSKGTPSCVDCKIDGSGCYGAQMCGDGVATKPEQCDGMDFGGETCESLGFFGGTLGCSTSCFYDVANCTTEVPPGTPG